MSGATGIAWDVIMPAIQQWIMRGAGVDNAHAVWAPQPGAPRPSGPFVSMRITAVDQIGNDWYAREPNVLTVPTIAVTAVAVAPSSTLTAPAHGRVTGDGPLEVGQAGGGLPAPLQPGNRVWAIVVDPSTLKLAASFQDAMASSPIALTSAGSGTITIAGLANTVRAGQEVTQRLRGPRVATLEITAFAGAGGVGVGAPSPTAMIDGVLTACSLESIWNVLVAAGVGVGNWDKPRSLGEVVNATEFEPRAFVSIEINLASEYDEPSTFIEQVHATNNISDTPETITISTADS